MAPAVAPVMAPAAPTPARPPEAVSPPPPPESTPTGVACPPQRLGSVSEEAQGAAPALGAPGVAVPTGAPSEGPRVSAAARWRRTSIKVSVTKVCAMPVHRRRPMPLSPTLITAHSRPALPALIRTAHSTSPRAYFTPRHYLPHARNGRRRPMPLPPSPAHHNTQHAAPCLPRATRLPHARNGTL